jgi:lipid-binding SYLF domain-containing protein
LAQGPEIEAEVQATLGEFFHKVGSAHELANRAVAILVFPTVVKAGFGIGGEYGEGALHIRGQAVAITISFPARSAFNWACKRAR